MGFWLPSAYMGSGGPKKSLYFLLNLFHISEGTNEKLKQSATEQALPLSKRLRTAVLFLGFFPQEKYAEGKKSVKQNNDEELFLWMVAVPFLPAIFYGSRFSACLVVKRIYFCLGIPQVRKCQ